MERYVVKRRKWRKMRREYRIFLYQQKLIHSSQSICEFFICRER